MNKSPEFRDSHFKCEWKLGMQCTETTQCFGIKSFKRMITEIRQNYNDQLSLWWHFSVLYTQFYSNISVNKRPQCFWQLIFPALKEGQKSKQTEIEHGCKCVRRGSPALTHCQGGMTIPILVWMYCPLDSFFLSGNCSFTCSFIIIYYTSILFFSFSFSCFAIYYFLKKDVESLGRRSRRIFSKLLSLLSFNMSSEGICS